ncbi:hypothetical protein HO173_009071 [Letharia columbiana]|uniref:Uncharacterized protein n=1 Tax=Letharia columbiana TaxID=112416 RepID=A0A8H6FQ47_9LECA|nr:uncharacterized protein HO173_009071 [Letharia columbiana]KAF6232632.1 hypothetical protein HO173_009071 [Letharia columbiana]
MNKGVGEVLGDETFDRDSDLERILESNEDLDKYEVEGIDDRLIVIEGLEIDIDRNRDDEVSVGEV